MQTVKASGKRPGPWSLSLGQILRISGPSIIRCSSIKDGKVRLVVEPVPAEPPLVEVLEEVLSSDMPPG